jgi:hypothetical protein
VTDIRHEKNPNDIYHSGPIEKPFISFSRMTVSHLAQKKKSQTHTLKYVSSEMKNTRRKLANNHHRHDKEE